MLFLNGTFTEALPYLQKAAEVQTDSSEAHSFLADEYEKLGRAGDAARERAAVEELKAHKQ
jgi:Flp pilus assembly protein TadD